MTTDRYISSKKGLQVEPQVQKKEDNGTVCSAILRHKKDQPELVSLHAGMPLPGGCSLSVNRIRSES